MPNQEALRWVRELKDAERRGNEFAVETIRRRLEDAHWDMVVGTVRRKITPRQASQLARAAPGEYEPDDLPVKAFTRVWKRIEAMPTVPDDFNFGGYLQTTITNLCLDALRRLQAWETVDSLDESREDDEGEQTSLHDKTPSPSLKPEEEMEAGEFSAALDKALEQLPERQRQVFSARAEDGLSWDEIARMVGISKRTVQYDYDKAQETLKRLLRPDAGGDVS
jgi:RNA polymerase sigma-70 factor (ECF subfamily)